MRRTDVALALVSGVTLALEVFLTKLLAYTLHTMLLYVVLGLAMVGFGAAGSLVAMRSVWLERDRLPAALGWAAVSVPVSMVVCYAVYVRISAAAFGSWVVAGIAGAVLVPPFLGAGVVVALALSSEGSRPGRPYMANMIGSGLGAVAPLLVLGPLSGPEILGVLAVVACGAAWLYVREAEVAPTSRLSLALGGALVLSVAATFAAELVFPVVPEPLGQAEVIRVASEDRGVTVRTAYDRWDPTGRIEVFEYGSVPGGPDPYPFLFYAQDATSGSLLVRWNGPEGARERDDEVARLCTETVFAQGYARPRARVLVIGVGGGPDVQCALYHGATEVDAVEINGAAVAAVRGPFDDLLGGIGSHPSVRYSVQDGRSFVHAAPRRYYDLIQLSGVDTKHQFVSGALALSENHLYTREAFAEFLTRLRPGGVVATLRFGEWEMLRAVNTAVAALRDLGVEQPQRHVIVIQNGVLFASLVTRDPLTSEDVEAVRVMFDGKPFVGASIFFYEIFHFPLRVAPVMVYAPGRRGSAVLEAYFSRVADGNEVAFEDAYAWDVSATDDDRPFFFDVTRYDRAEGWRRPHVSRLLSLFATILALAVVLILFPVRRRRIGIDRAVAARALVLFGSLGLGYLFAEVWLLHAFTMYLGHRTVAMAVVLGVLLVTTGAGAVLGERAIPQPRARIGMGIGLALGWLALGVVGLATIQEWTGGTLWLRVVVTVAYVAPLGVVLGFPFPAALSWISAVAPSAAPWCVGINAFASVLATLIVLGLALGLGYTGVAAVAGAMYLVALAVGVRRPGPPIAR